MSVRDVAGGRGRTRARTTLTAVTLVVVPALLPIAVVWLLQPVDWVMVEPGSVRPAAVRIGGGAIRSSHIYTVDVRRRQLNRWQYHRSGGSRRSGLERSARPSAGLLATGGAVNGRESLPTPRQQLDDSRAAAAYAAASLDGRPADFRGHGVQVLSPPGGTGVDVGSVIVGVGSQAVGTWLDLIGAMERQAPGAPVAVTLRGGRRGTIERPEDVMHLPGFVGITLDSSARTVPPIAFSTRPDQSGDSAGLAFALAAYELLSGRDLTRSRMVVVTGAILPDGAVRKVGYVFEKAQAAGRAGADLMIVPSSVIGEAELGARKQFPVIGVVTMQEAVDALAADPAP